MRVNFFCVMLGLVAVSCLGCSSNSTTPSGGSGGGGFLSGSDGKSSAKISGFAFVDSSVTGAGQQAKLPAGTKIYFSGSTLTGTEGCTTNRYHTDGQPVVVIDFSGQPSAGSVQVTRHPATGGNFQDAPYYLDLNDGQLVQNLGPVYFNGSYDVQLAYNYNLGQQKTVSAKFTLARNCPY